MTKIREDLLDGWMEQLAVGNVNSAGKGWIGIGRTWIT
jgi:hypothetical protein